MVHPATAGSTPAKGGVGSVCTAQIPSSLLISVHGLGQQPSYSIWQAPIDSPRGLPLWAPSHSLSWQADAGGFAFRRDLGAAAGTMWVPMPDLVV